MQIVLAQNVLDLVEARAGAAGLDADPFRFFEDFGLLHLHGDACQLGSSLLLGQRVVVFGGLRFAHDFIGAHDLAFRERDAPSAGGPARMRPRPRLSVRRL
ncbi:hypothetical protein SDC9_198126 [bioreactor metagenome]|uniref:Uncharacterized protein n=1 Tax=bioreactor metagenome TaxID=1076179 RepID=A0A645IJ40_9ZZZZ